LDEAGGWLHHLCMASIENCPKNNDGDDPQNPFKAGSHFFTPRIFCVYADKQ
jgi:hypothetical protein